MSLMPSTLARRRSSAPRRAANCFAPMMMPHIYFCHSHLIVWGSCCAVCSSFCLLSLRNAGNNLFDLSESSSIKHDSYTKSSGPKHH